MKRFRTQLIVNFVVLSIIPVVIVALFSYRISANALKKLLIQSSLATVDQINKNVEEKVAKINKYIDVFCASAKVHEVLNNVDFDSITGDDVVPLKELNQLFSSYLYGDRDVRSVMLFQQVKGHYVFNGYIENESALREEDWFKGINGAGGQTVWVRRVDNFEPLSSGKRAFLVGRLVKDTGYLKNLDALGLIVFVLNEDILSDIYKNVKIGPDDITIVTDENGRILSPDRNFELKTLSEYPFGQRILEGNKECFSGDYSGKEVMVTYYTLISNGWKIVRFIPYTYMYGEIRNISKLTILITVLCLILINIVSFVTAGNFSKPVHELLDSMKKIGKKEFDAFVPVRARNEIGAISTGFNNMLKDIQTLFNKVVIEEKMKRKAEIQALQYQINPHFLYNTLSSIRLMTVMKRTEEAAEMLLILSRLLRNTITKADTLITVSEEINNLKDYLKIQQIRNYNCIKADFETDNGICSLKIFPMILQPIVENAILHGLNDKLNSDSCDAKIVIRGYIDRGNLIFEVCDNGNGMSSQQIREILEGGRDSLPDGSVRIGIKNIDDRIKLEYGIEYGVRIESQLGEFTMVRICLPVMENGGEKGD